MNISIDHLLEEYQGSPLCLRDLPQYDQEALEFFTDEAKVEDPFIDFSITHDISLAKQSFEKRKPYNQKDSFNAYLLWSAARSISETPHLNWRKFQNIWYEFKNPPFCMPISTGTRSRLSNVILKNIPNCTFEAFATKFREEIDRAKREEKQALFPDDLFYLAHNLNSLPFLRFTGLKAHVGKIKSTHVWWCFGQRFENGASSFIPIMIRMHHANGDPLVLKTLLEAFDNLIGNLA